ncbi:DNA repair protein XRCC3 isoform X2 [Puntigrus tetrazona]|uniref:DNA repair protein XRCC3 isoform X2 n=1 Tax=Puntigrus tetrazona TaxID=1606681 RepID=UPI001C8AEA0B|nr:DNA repair protein XRCC3 isoform X2 [Puntigrus tetrazona]
MEWERFDLNPRIITAVKKANFRSAKEVLCVSGPDLQRLTRLSKTDVHRLHYAVAAAVRRSEPATALQLVRGECPVLEAGHRLSFACPVLDGLTRGGLPLRGITELAGESAAGKTQICLQLCLSVQYPQENGGLGSGAVYICTEDSFPIKRLRQLITQQPQLRADLPPALIRSLRFSDNIYIEHASDLVTDVVDGPNPGRCDYGLVGSKVLPALGIAWANQVMVRLMLRRLTGRVQSDSRSSAPRKLEVVFAPHLPRASCLCGVWEEGVRGIPDGHSELQPHTSS